MGEPHLSQSVSFSLGSLGPVVTGQREERQVTCAHRTDLSRAQQLSRRDTQSARSLPVPPGNTASGRGGRSP